ncbi:MAG TPA: DUF692 family protein [Thermoanaerobaculia bacterium]|jgi:hypothetical protein|nr:DUF692 family protein [Thermoanaerobaculia bacterium]
MVGLLNNPAIPGIISAAGSLVEYVEVIPDRLWFDFGQHGRGGRFHKTHATVAMLRELSRTKKLTGHGIGLSLPSAMPLDEEMLAEIASLNRQLDFQWYSEHLSMFLVPHGSVPNAQAGLGLPIAYDDEMFALVREKLARLRQILDCPLLMENPSVFTPIDDAEMSEPEFLNRLWDEERCGTLLDLHNLYVSWRHGGMDPFKYLGQLNPDAVTEIHLAGGDEIAGFYTDSHSRLTPPEVWEYAYEIVPRCHNLRGITFEFHESYFPRLGLPGILGELESMHELASRAGVGVRASGVGDEPRSEFAGARDEAAAATLEISSSTRESLRPPTPDTRHPSPDFQQALADLVSSPALCIEARRDPAVLRNRYQLTDRESSRLEQVVNHPGMACNCMLYRANRLAPLALNLPDLIKALGPDLREMLDAFWSEFTNTDVHFYVESYRFCEFIERQIANGRNFAAEVAPALEREMAVLARRLEVSHTEIYSPLREQRVRSAVVSTAGTRASRPSAGRRERKSSS